ncbi:MAG: hypothetical protein ACRCVT_00100, partial [Leadbetterella sp.]
MKNITGKNRLYLIVFILFTASCVYRFLYFTTYFYTSILFVGLPTLITILVIYYGKTPQTTNGMVFKVITLFLLMAAILLGEGTICILMGAPIFYGVGGLIVWIKNRNKSNKIHVFVLIPVLLVVLEPQNIHTNKKKYTIVTSKFISNPTGLNSLEALPNFQENLPSFFKIGFPKPLAIFGNGMKKGDTRTIQFQSPSPGKGYLIL